MNMISRFVCGLSLIALAGCNAGGTADSATGDNGSMAEAADREYFHLRPEVEKAFGYTHAIRIGNEIKVSGAVSMDDQGNPTAVGDMQQQVRNVYADLDEILQHFGLTFDDVVVENAYTTDMAAFLAASGHRATVYGERFPAGTWVEVEGLAFPEFLIEIEIEAIRSH